MPASGGNKQNNVPPHNFMPCCQRLKLTPRYALSTGPFGAFPRLRPRRAERRGTLNFYHKMGAKLPKKYGQANMDKTGRIAKKVKFWGNNAKFYGTYSVSFVSYIVCQKNSS
jgi:hypothetical protein